MLKAFRKKTVRSIGCASISVAILAVSRPASAQSSVLEGRSAQSSVLEGRTARDTSISVGTVVLGDLYALVQRRNQRSAAARSLAQAAQARVSQATRPPDPQLQLGFMNYSLPSLRPMDKIGMVQLQLMQMLPLGGKLALAGRAAGAVASATAERAKDVALDARSQAAMAFYDLYATDQSLGIARETIRLLHDIGSIAEAMYRVGDGRQTDVLRANVEIAKMVEDTLRMQAMRQSMIARLNALLDRQLEAAFGTPLLPRFPDSIPLRSWLDSVAFGERPIVRAGLDEVRAAEVSEKLARKEIIPDLTLGAQYGQQSGEMGGTDRMGSLMFGVSLPVFARERQFKMREEAGAMKQMAQADLAAMRAETRGKIGEAYAALTRARTLARLYRTTVFPQAEATVESALAAYRVGTVDFMTLLDDRMIVNKYRQELYGLDADQGKAWAELEMLIGRTLIDSNSTSNEASAPATTAGGAK